MAGSRRLETAALLLPVLGALLFVSPLLSVFNLPMTVFGIPLIALYLFAVWIGLIAVSFFLSRRLVRDGADTGSDGEPPR